jgi:NAD+--asparagine ADP-ribosyltransferase
MAHETGANSDGLTFPMADSTVSPENIDLEQPVAESSSSSSSKSALQENLERKGKNAYYFAHAHKANGPKWDGKAEPKLLSSRSMSSDEQASTRVTSFDFHKSNITSYSFCDAKSNVKLYIELENVGEKCTDDDISLEYTESSFCLVIHNFNKDHDERNQPLCLSFGKLTANITKAACKKRQDRIILTLTKEQEGAWHSVNDKGAL